MASAKRGDDDKLIYTCFAYREGVEDRLLYPNELIQLHQKLLSVGRKPMIVNGGFSQPTPEEIQNIRRGTYRSINDAITGLSTNFSSGTALGLQSIAVRAFMEILSEEGLKPGANPSRISSIAVYLLCWFKRCYSHLFEGWKPKHIGCLIYMGACQNEREALFLRFLSKLPTDIVIFNPNLEESSCLQDPMLFVQTYAESMVMKTFPQENSSMRISTAASQAERDLDGTLYNDTGLYRNRQFDAAQALVLNSTYEEIALYWDQELKYRPSFNTVNNTVMMPVLFAQVSGVKNGDMGAYWLSIKPLITADTIVVRQFPMFTQADMTPIASSAVDFYRNGRLQRDKLKGHRQYPFAMLREETQDYILNKLQILIDQKTINLFGLRRKVNQTIYDIGVIRDILSDIINVFSHDYVISGPVWEYFGDSVDAAWADGLRREMKLDFLNGFIGKTAIHPAQLPVIFDGMKVSRSDYEDAQSILAWNRKGYAVAKSSDGSRMNEVKCHTRWAEKINCLGSLYGITEDA